MFELISNKLDGIDSRQDEIFKVVKAIEHANQVHKAEIDSVKVMTWDRYFDYQPTQRIFSDGLARRIQEGRYGG